MAQNLQGLELLETKESSTELIYLIVMGFETHGKHDATKQRSLNYLGW